MRKLWFWGIAVLLLPGCGMLNTASGTGLPASEAGSRPVQGIMVPPPATPAEAASPQASATAASLPGATPTPALASTPTPFLPAPTPTSPPPVPEASRSQAERLQAAEAFSAPPPMLPDLQTLAPHDLRLVYDPASQRRYLRFSNSIWNSGPGRLELLGRPDPVAESIHVTQRMYSAEARIVDEQEVGVFTFHPLHNHWHLEAFALYEVWTLDPGGDLEDLAFSGGKISYCVTDVSRASPDAPRRAYFACRGKLQGLSVDWVDTYEFNLAGQWVEITGLEDGVYALVSVVDPDDLIREQDDGNNGAVLHFALQNNRVRVVDPDEVP